MWPNLGGKWVVFQALGREVEHPYMGVYLAVCHLYGYQIYPGVSTMGIVFKLTNGLVHKVLSQNTWGLRSHFLCPEGQHHALYF